MWLRKDIAAQPAPNRETALPDVTVTGSAGDAMRRATMLAVGVMFLFMTMKATWSASAGGVGQMFWVVALFVLPSLYTFPNPRRLLDRHRWLVLAAQAVLTWVPLAVFGGSWNAGLGGLLAGLVLLTMRSRWSWLVAGLLLAADLLVRVTVNGMLQSPGWLGVVSAADLYVDDGLFFFAVVRLAKIVGEVEQAHRQAADMTVADERMRAARALQTAVGLRLAEIAAKVDAARSALAHDAAEARVQIAEAGSKARETVARARAITADGGSSPTLDRQISPVAGVMFGARLAWSVLVVMLISFPVEGFYNAFLEHDSAWLWTALTVANVLTVALQLRHSGAARRSSRPRWWPATLALQATLMYVFYIPPLNILTTNVGFLAGSILLLMPYRWRWAAFAAVVFSWSALYATVPLKGEPDYYRNAFGVLYFAALYSLTGLEVYGISWLARLARQLEGLRGEVARMAAVQERLRVDQDIHDLLGLGLSAVALKSDLVGALVGRDDSKAAIEMAEISRICAAAQSDVRLVTGDGARLFFFDELAAAQRILTSAGIMVATDLPDGPLSAAADEVLAPVLREAVTNVLRHSAATHCVISVTLEPGRLLLSVRNDGAAQQLERPVRGDGGHGLANMTARMQAAGGQLCHRWSNGEFQLATEIPLADVRKDHPRSAGRVTFPPVRRRALHSRVDDLLASGHGTDGVDEFSGGPALEQVPGYPGVEGGS